MRIAVVDGQGGGIGRAIIEKIKAAGPAELDIIALGTNAAATAVMLKAGAGEGATGENAIIVNAPKVQTIIGSVAILAADSMLGEMTPVMAKAIAQSPAQKILLPLNRCNIYIAGTRDILLAQCVEDAVEKLKTGTF